MSPAAERTHRPAPLWQRAAIVGVGVVIAAVMAGLGLWQAQVFVDDGVRLAAARASLPTEPLDRVAPPEVSPVEFYGRTVEFAGEYLPQTQLVIPDGDRYRVLTALRTDAGYVVPVLRGVSDSASPPPPPAGRVSRSGVLLAPELGVDVDLPPGQIGSVRLARLAQFWPQPLISGFVTLPASEAEAEGLAPDRLRLPELDGSVRNQGYALQWWVFGAFALGISIKIAYDAGRGRGVLSRRL